MKDIFRSGKHLMSVGMLLVLVLIALPENLLYAQITVNQGTSVSVKNVNSIIVDKDNIKWFSTDTGIVSFDGLNWKLHRDIHGIPKS